MASYDGSEASGTYSSSEDEMTHHLDSNGEYQENNEDTESRMNVANTVKPMGRKKSKTDNIKTKMIVIYNVLKTLIRESLENNVQFKDDVVERVAHLTGMDSCTVLNIIHKRPPPVQKYFFEQTVVDTPKLDYSIRQLLYKKYVKFHKIPGTECFFDMTRTFKLQLNELLKISGYVWRRLPNTKRAIIVEHPKRFISRQRYLREIFQIRQENRSIVYIETKVFSKADINIEPFKGFLTEDVNCVVVFMAVDNMIGFLQAQVLVCKCILDSQKLIENHIITNVIPKVSEPSVIILEEKMYYTKSLPVPSIDSEKFEMTKWLKLNGVPHEENLHRSELFELIENCKNKHDLHYFDTIINGLGHKILRRPPRTEYLNYYSPIWEKFSASENAAKSMSDRGLKFWKHLESNLKYSENIIINEDMAMEKVIDQILTMARDVDVTTWANEECEEHEDTLVQEEFVVQLHGLHNV